MSGGDDSDFRRGYTHGYAQALEDMRTVTAGGASSKNAWTLLARFHDRFLLPWRSARASRHQPPPAFDRSPA